MKPVETVSKRFSKIGDRVGGGPGPHYPWNVHNRDPKMGSCCKYLCHVYIYYVHRRRGGNSARKRKSFEFKRREKREREVSKWRNVESIDHPRKSIRPGLSDDV